MYFGVASKQFSNQVRATRENLVSAQPCPTTKSTESVWVWELGGAIGTCLIYLRQPDYKNLPRYFYVKPTLRIILE